MTVIDCDAGSASYGQVVGWTELPTAGNELHHFGWNACSSALCHEGHDGRVLERRYLIVPGIRSSRIYVLDTKPDPRQPQRRAHDRGRGACRQGRLLAAAHACIAGPAGSSCPTSAAPTAATGPAGSP